MSNSTNTALLLVPGWFNVQRKPRVPQTINIKLQYFSCVFHNIFMRNANIRSTWDCLQGQGFETEKPSLNAIPFLHYPIQSKIPKHWPVIFVMKPSNYLSGFCVRQPTIPVQFSMTDRQTELDCPSIHVLAIIIITRMKRHEDDLQLISMQNNPFGISGRRGRNLEGNGYLFSRRFYHSLPRWQTGKNYYNESRRERPEGES